MNRILTDNTLTSMAGGVGRGLPQALLARDVYQSKGARIQQKVCLALALLVHGPAAKPIVIAVLHRTHVLVWNSKAPLVGLGVKSHLGVAKLSPDGLEMTHCLCRWQRCQRVSRSIKWMSTSWQDYASFHAKQGLIEVWEIAEALLNSKDDTWVFHQTIFSY